MYQSAIKDNLRIGDNYLQNLYKNQFLKILPENIRGLKHKVNEFLCHLQQGLPMYYVLVNTI
jgi:hypothetical protein